MKFKKKLYELLSVLSHILANSFPIVQVGAFVAFDLIRNRPEAAVSIAGDVA